MPHSVFLGRILEPGDPQWLDEDRDKVVAYLADRAARCSNCGLHDDDVGADGMPLMFPLFIPETHRCFMCQEVAIVRKEVPAGEDDGITVRIRPTVAADFEP